MSRLLGGKTVLITNVSTPLGYSIAQRLGFAGANLFVADSHDQRLRKAVHSLKEHGLTVAGAVVDVNKADQRKQLFDEVVNKYKVLDALIVNNPVNTITGPINDTTSMQFDETYNNYLTVPFRLCQVAAPHLAKSKGGSIVLMTSFTAFSPFEDVGLYSAAQTSVLGLCKATLISLGKKNIRINSVALGMMKEDGSGAFWDKADDSRLTELAKVIPLGRIPKNVDCAGMVEFLVSDRSSYITGENCVVNGGVSVRI
uniref:Short-chain dehydrogenase n=1 Tax=Panagrolaimus sp. JU765 TaxID=591449 RepID=A0AC34RGU4_9BILA